MGRWRRWQQKHQILLDSLIFYEEILSYSILLVSNDVAFDSLNSRKRCRAGNLQFHVKYSISIHPTALVTIIYIEFNAAAPFFLASQNWISSLTECRRRTQNVYWNSWNFAKLFWHCFAPHRILMAAQRQQRNMNIEYLISHCCRVSVKFGKAREKSVKLSEGWRETGKKKE